MNNAEWEFYSKYTSTKSLVDIIDFDGLIDSSLEHFNKNIKPALPVNLNANILDIGCGYGRYIYALSLLGYNNVTGVDISKEQINIAKSILKIENVQQADIFQWLSNTQNQYDCILGIDILEHFPTDKLFLLGKKISNSLKAGGVAIFQVPNAMSPMNPIISGDLTHFRGFTIESMQQFLLNSDLSSIEFIEPFPAINSISRVIKIGVWKLIIKPAIYLFLRAVHGKIKGPKIYTSNFIVVARK